MEGQYGALRHQQPTCPNLGRLLQMESAMPEIKSNHVEMMRQLADALSGVDCDRFNLYLAAAEKCVKQSVPIAEAVRELNRQYAVSVSAKSMVNELGAAVRLAEHFGGFKAYDDKVNEHNAKQVANRKRQSFGHQGFLITFGLAKRPPAKSGKGAPSLDAAVKAGVITKQQAQALRKMGF